MRIDWKKVSIYIKPGYTDMRKQHHSLMHVVEHSMGKNIFDGSLYVFCNRSRTTIKVVYWDKNGLCLWTKRLEMHRFPWPKDEAEARAISAQYFLLLLQGINIFSEHTELKKFYSVR